MPKLRFAIDTASTPHDYFVAICKPDGSLARIGQSLPTREDAQAIVGFLNYEPKDRPSAGDAIAAYVMNGEVGR